MAKPDDSAFKGGDLCYPDDDTDPECLGITDALSTPRATAQSRFARAYGYDFAQVSCHKMYYRDITRQEVWEEYGMQSWEDEFVDGKGNSLDDLRDAGVPEDQLPEPPELAPEDWEVPDNCAAYTFCSPNHQQARPVWICEA